MRIAYITAGAAGMYCGSCLHDNTLAAALMALGHDVVLVPTYTPIRTDEPDVSQHRVFMGGINVYLQQKLAVFRHTPWAFDRLFDAPGLLRWVSRFAVKTQGEDVADLFLSMLRGQHGNQRKEIDKLTAWLADDVRPQIVNLTNVLISGIIPQVKRRLGVPVVCTLQGDDIFLEALPESVRKQALALIAEHCQQVDGFIATSRYYADFMAGYLAIPRERIRVVYPGLNLAGHGQPRVDSDNKPFTIGYFARVCPEKGLHLLADAFRILRQGVSANPCRFRVSGWLGESNRTYFEGIVHQMQQWNLAADFDYVPAPDHASKLAFLRDLDVLSVPTVYREPKGLYILEALANGVPVVQPRHGSFPELLEATGGGLLVNPGDTQDLAAALGRLEANREHGRELGRKGKEAVHRDFHAAAMAQKTLAVYQEHAHD
jgi:glycosyltransferase involved in cell wall biosynthesis